MSEYLEKLFGLSGKVALVTGASGGIGAALAKSLAAAGASVLLHGTNSEKLGKVQQNIEQEGGICSHIAIDICAEGAPKQLVESTVQTFGKLDILVNCAGINRRNSAAAATENEFDEVVDVNLKGLYFICQAAHPHLCLQGGGKIVNIGSVTSTYGVGGISIYGATKAAVAHLTKTLAVEWAPNNIQVNCLAPGFIITPMNEIAVWGDKRRKDWILARTPMKRPGTVEDLEGTCVMLCSHASDFLTGELITIDGGFISGGWWDTD